MGVCTCVEVDVCVRLLFQLHLRHTVRRGERSLVIVATPKTDDGRGGWRGLVFIVMKGARQ